MLKEIASALPESFEFYHLGSVRLEPVSQPPAFSEISASELEAVAYRLYGEIGAVIIVLFDKGLDRSTYEEMGNIIASRTASRFGAMISPPTHLAPEKLGKWLERYSAASEYRSYVHLHRGVAVALRTVVIATQEEIQGHA